MLERAFEKLGCSVRFYEIIFDKIRHEWLNDLIDYTINL